MLGVFQAIMASRDIGFTKDVIAINGKIPWRCPEDMAFFKKTTMGHVVIMGRVTFDSIGKPLPGRVNMVCSRQPRPEDLDQEVLWFNDVDACVECCRATYPTLEWFVIGGPAIYQCFISRGLVAKFWHTLLHEARTNLIVPMNASDQVLTYRLGRSLPGNFNTSVINKRPLGGSGKHTGDHKFLDSLEAQHSDAVAIVYEILIVNQEEAQILELMSNLITHGKPAYDRTQVGTMSSFGEFFEFDLSDDKFPLMTTRRLPLRMIFEELHLYISGKTDNNILRSKDVHVWDANTTREFLDARGLQRMPPGDMGASYGFLMRHFGAPYDTCLKDYTGQGVDQLQYVIDTIQREPNNRRMIISLWDPTNLHNCPLPPCLHYYQFDIGNVNPMDPEDPEDLPSKLADMIFPTLNCLMVQRSSDIAVAGGWNVATGALLTYMIAAICSKKTGIHIRPGTLKWCVGNSHVYLNLIEDVKEQLKRTPKIPPRLRFRNVPDRIEDFCWKDLELMGYIPDDRIRMQMNP